MNKFLNKVAFDYTPKDWRKYSTPEERKLIQRAESKLAANIYKSILSNALYNLPGAALGSLSAGLTPTWSNEDMKEFVDSKNYGKKLFIPGYNPYTNFKILGYQREIQKRVEEAAKKAKEKKLAKSASMSKEDDATLTSSVNVLSALAGLGGTAAAGLKDKMYMGGLVGASLLGAAGYHGARLMGLGGKARVLAWLAGTAGGAFGGALLADTTLMPYTTTPGVDMPLKVELQQGTRHDGLTNPLYVDFYRGGSKLHPIYTKQTN